MAGGRRPPSLPGPGRTHNLLSSPGGASTARNTVLPPSSLSLPAAEPRARLGRESRGGQEAQGLRKGARRRRPCSPRSPRVSGGGSGGALWPRGAPGLARGGAALPLAGEARTASSPPPPGPPLAPVPSPHARRDPERTQRGRGRRGPSPRARRAGRRVGGAAAARWGPAHPRGRLSRLRGPRAPSRPPRPATPSH